MRKLFAGLAAMAIAAFGAVEAKADKLQDILSKGVVRIGVPLDAPPFGSQDADRKAVGFDIEMAEMVAKGLGVKLEMQQITGANRIPFLMTDKVDIVISVMGLTPERARQIQFTAPYANTFLAVYGAKSSANVSSPDTIGSARVAAAKGTTQELAISESPRRRPMPDAHRGRRDGRCRLHHGPGRSPRHQLDRGAGARQAEPEQGVRAQVRHPPKPGPYGRADGPA